VVAGIDDLRCHGDVLAVELRAHLEFRHVEPERVEPPDARIELVAILARDDQGARHLVPQAVVARTQADAGDDRIDAVVQAATGLQVHELAGHVGGGGLEVVLALPFGQAGMQLPGLSIDEVCGEGTRVAPEQRVGQRAVVPGEAGQVQLHDEDREGVEQSVGRLEPK